MCEKLEMDPKEIHFIDGDTDRVAFGMGSNGSRSMVTGGSALTLAAQKVIDKGKKLAAHLLEAAEADIEYAGRFSVAGTDRGMTLKQVVAASFRPAAAAGNGAGAIRDMRPMRRSATRSRTAAMFARWKSIRTPASSNSIYLVVDDVGTVINPLTLAGQIHGGVAQGVGQS